MPWIKLWNRKHTLQHDYFGRCLWFLDNPYYNIKNFMTVSAGKGKADFYCDRREWDELMSKMAQEVFSKNYLPMVRKRFVIDRDLILKAARQVSRPSELKILSSAKLFERYEQLKKAYLRYTYFFWTPWAINQVVVPWFEKELNKRFSHQAGEIFKAVTTPVKRTLMDAQRLMLLSYKIRGILKEKMESHLQKYQWLGVYSLADQPLTKVDFLRQIQGIKYPKQFLRDQKQSLKARRSAFQKALRVLKEYPKLLKLAEI